MGSVKRQQKNTPAPPYGMVLARRKALGNPPEEVVLHCGRWEGGALMSPPDWYMDTPISPLVMPGDRPAEWDWRCVSGLDVLVFPNGKAELVTRELASLLLHAGAAVVRVVTPSWTHVYRQGAL